MNATKIAVMSNVLACFCFMAMRASGEDEAGTKPSSFAMGDTDNCENFANARSADSSQGVPAVFNQCSDAVGENSVALLSDRATKTKTPKTKTEPPKSTDGKSKSKGGGVISWLWIDTPGAPSVRRPRNGSGAFPKFK